MTDAWRRSWKLVVATVLALLCGAAARAVIGAEIPADGENAVVDVPAADLPADAAVAEPVLIDGTPEDVIEGEIVWEEAQAGFGPGGTCVTEAPAGCIAGCGGGCSGGCRLRCDETYTIFDVVFFQRDNQSTDQILAAIGPDAVITSGQPQFAVQPGIRLFTGRVDDQCRGWEVGYLGVWNMFADLEEGGVADISAGDPLGLLAEGFDGRSLARATYLSTLNTAEANLLWRSCHRGFSRVSAYPWERCCNYRRGTFDWLTGFRWAGLDEAAGLEFSGADYPGPSTYNVRSTTNFFGAQIGGRGRMEWDRWAIDGWAKAALAGTALSQSADPIVSFSQPGEPWRPARSATEGGVGFIGDINVTLAYRLNDTWRLRTGYNFLWLTGVALAPNQLDFGGPTAGTGLNGGAGVLLHGANLGLEASW